MSAVSHFGFVAIWGWRDVAGSPAQGLGYKHLHPAPWTTQAGILIQFPQPLPASDHVRMTTPQPPQLGRTSPQPCLPCAMM